MIQKITALLIVLFFTISAAAAAQAQEVLLPRTEEFRGVWIATVANTNWPNKGESSDSQKQDFIRLLDEAVTMRLNAVVVQIRPTADAFYKSKLNPWSEYLTGTQGLDPGYDPLAFMIEESHKRGLEFHAWFNPFRVSTTLSNKKWAPNSVVSQHPDWVRKYGSQLWLDPGIPRVRKYVVDSIIEVVENYDIDAVHFDDYFYPYPVSGASFPDNWAYETYHGAFTNRADWRRDNINTFLKTMYAAIKAAKNKVKFGVSPIGIWRNKASDPTGSDTDGSASYDRIYADTKLWVTEGWLDYIAPQIYWNIGFRAAPYEVLLDFWVNVAKQNTNVHLYIGQAAYQVGTSGAWRNASELPHQLELSRASSVVKGHIYYNIDSLIKNPLSLRDTLVNSFYQTAAAIPVMPWLAGQLAINVSN
jgi:uncharacterized lipoprotein YddW (UPF0748 family)